MRKYNRTTKEREREREGIQKPDQPVQKLQMYIIPILV
jgi:hypothetical protein